MDRTSLYFTGPREVDLEPTTVDPTPDEVVVETRVSAVSAGTELLIYRDEVPADVPADETLDALEGDLTYPVRYGYAAVGEVAETGGRVDDDWLGRSVFGFNPHESRFAARPESLLSVPEGVTDAEMAMYPSAETATSLVLDGRPRLDERVVVFGAGVIGLCTVGVLSAFPLERLVAVDPVESRRERAVEMGADRAVSPDEVEAAVGDTTVAGDADGADLVYELSGQPEALDDAIDAAGYDSRVVVGSWYGQKDATLELGTDFHRDRVSVESSQVSTLAPETTGRWTKDRRRDAALSRLGDLDVESLVTHRVPFREAPEAYELLDADPESALQVLLTYDDATTAHRSPR
jgi:2-desacetyl-2-hydroxyethyl bacteriochlorophyllide A dehydrogenase